MKIGNSQKSLATVVVTASSIKAKDDKVCCLCYKAVLAVKVGLHSSSIARLEKNRRVIVKINVLCNTEMDFGKK